MENQTKFSNEQINSMIDDFKNKPKGEKIDAQQFMNKHLSEDQVDAVNKAIGNPDLIQSILSSPQAKKFIDKLTSKKE